MANVTTGFSLPYVALYAMSGSSVVYSSGMSLARGVNVSLSPDSSGDINFYADNIIAESAGGVFTTGTVTLTVDGLSEAAEKLVYNLPTAGSDGFVNYGSNSVPFVGVGFVVRSMNAGTEYWRAIVLPKVKFQTPGTEAATQEETIAFQTQELVASIFRDDTSNKTWLKKGSYKTTESAAEAEIKTLFSIT